MDDCEMEAAEHVSPLGWKLLIRTMQGEPFYAVDPASQCTVADVGAFTRVAHMPT